jgi:two-component system phosphate regulon sensor histidine kinase PhoR
MKKTMSQPKKTSPKVDRASAESDALFLSIGEGAIATDEHGNISRVNKAALKILGFKAEDLIGKWYPNTIIAEDIDGNVIPNMERPITQIFLSGKPIFKRVYYRKKDGTRIPIALTVSPVMLDDKPVGAIEVFRDISEEIEVENVKDEFISIASHQLRTPATVVKQNLGLLIEGFVGKLSPKQQQILKIAYKYNDNQLHTISDLLKVAQADSNEIKLVRQQVNLVSLIEDIVQSQIREYDKKDLTLEFKSSVDEANCKVDPLHIRMVFENLLDNARKYSPEHKRVIISLKKSSTLCIITIEDQGVGIDKKDIPKLFQKFSRVENPLSAVGGTGLGLYWVKKLITLHNGSIEVSSKLSAGTTFTIKLPTGMKGKS